MIRGAFYGTVGATLGILVPSELSLGLWLPAAALTWLFVTLYAGLPLLLAAMLVEPIQRAVGSLAHGRLFLPIAVLAAVPFGILIGSLLVALFEWSDSLANDYNWVHFLRASIAGGIGLGWGCANGVRPQD